MARRQGNQFLLRINASRIPTLAPLDFDVPRFQTADIRTFSVVYACCNGPANFAGRDVIRPREISAFVTC